MSKNTIVSLDRRLHALFGEYASLTSQTPKTVKTTVKEVLKFQSTKQLTTEAVIKVCEFVSNNINLKKNYPVEQSYVLYSPLFPANC